MLLMHNSDPQEHDICSMWRNCVTTPRYLAMPLFAVCSLHWDSPADILSSQDSQGSWQPWWELLILVHLDKAPRPSIINVIWILSSDTICQLNHIFFQIVRRQCCLSPPSSPEDKVYFVFLKSHSMSLVPLYIIAHKSDTKWQQLRHRCDGGTSVKSTKRAKSAVKCHKDSAAARFFYLPWK